MINEHSKTQPFSGADQENVQKKFSWLRWFIRWVLCTLGLSVGALAYTVFISARVDIDGIAIFSLPIAWVGADLCWIMSFWEDKNLSLASRIMLTVGVTFGAIAALPVVFLVSFILWVVLTGYHVRLIPFL